MRRKGPRREAKEGSRGREREKVLGGVGRHRGPLVERRVKAARGETPSSRGEKIASEGTPN